MRYTYVADKVIEIDGVRYFFSMGAYKTMQRDFERYNIKIEDIDDDLLLMYCNNFEVI